MQQIARVEVISSTIKSIGHSGGRVGTLEVEFHNGAIWRYFDVNAMEYHNLLNAESIGSYYNTRIKGAYASENMTGKLNEAETLAQRYPEHAKLRALLHNPDLVKFAQWAYAHFGLGCLYDYSGNHMSELEVLGPNEMLARYLNVNLDTDKLAEEKEQMVKETLEKLGL